ncbi:MAG: Transposase family protein [Gemmatimonadales bacterium]|jgi:hypothetical protein|nr:Transposase family protein [Gemmatimonadales bacterium]
MVHAVLAKLGIPVTCKGGTEWLDALRPRRPYAGKMSSLRMLIETHTEEIGMLDEVITDVWPVTPGTG